MRRTIYIFLIVFLLLGAGNVLASDPGSKLSRGLNNTLLGWFEIVNEVGHETDNQGPWLGVPAGVVKGTAFAVRRTLAGVYEIVTFLLPNGQKGYEPVLLPDSVFHKR